MNNNIINYVVFNNKIKQRRLVFYPVAKNANSSAKLFFLRHLKLEKNYHFVYDEKPAYTLVNDKDFKSFDPKYDIVNFMPSYTPFSKVDAEEKCCIVREPLQRFISAYKNRVLYHRDKAFNNFSIDEVIEKLEIGDFQNRHFLPQTYWLGFNLNYFTITASVNNLKTFIDNVNNFFENFVEFPKIQTGGKNLKITLNDDQIKKIKKIYQSDYELIGDFIKKF